MQKSEKPKYPCSQAQRVAAELIEMLDAGCERISVAGSIRREVPMVSDIELLIIPSAAETPLGRLLLGEKLEDLNNRGILRLRPNIRGAVTYGALNKLLLHVPSGIPVDIFTTSRENWGMALFVRTGPRDWNIRAMTRLRALGLKGHAYGGIEMEDGTQVSCPDESTVFYYLQWEAVNPCLRR